MKSFYQGCGFWVLGEFLKYTPVSDRGASCHHFSSASSGILKRSMVTHAGVKWVDGKELSDLDFADDIVLLHNSWAGHHKESKMDGMRMDQESMTKAAVRWIPLNGKKTGRPKIDGYKQWRKTQREEESVWRRYLSWHSTERPGRSWLPYVLILALEDLRSKVRSSIAKFDVPWFPPIFGADKFLVKTSQMVTKRQCISDTLDDGNRRLALGSYISSYDFQ